MISLRPASIFDGPFTLATSSTGETCLLEEMIPLAKGTVSPAVSLEGSLDASVGAAGDTCVRVVEAGIGLTDASGVLLEECFEWMGRA